MSESYNYHHPCNIDLSLKLRYNEDYNGVIRCVIMVNIIAITGTFDFIIKIITVLTNYIILCHYNILLGHFPILRQCVHTNDKYMTCDLTKKLQSVPSYSNKFL